jgi:hypothetical protein
MIIEELCKIYRCIRLGVKVMFKQASAALHETATIEYNLDDIKAMFPRFTNFEIAQYATRCFGGLKQMLTVISSASRTTKAHYTHPDPRVSDDEDVFRLTITPDDAQVEYIEFRFSPRLEYRDESVRQEKMSG